MAVCPVRLLAHKYDRLAEQWLENDDDDEIAEQMGALVLSVDELAPESVTGAAFLVACAVAELEHIIRGYGPPHIRLASERRVMRLLRHVSLFLGNASDDLPSAWKVVFAAGDDHLVQRYLTPA